MEALTPTLIDFEEQLMSKLQPTIQNSISAAMAQLQATLLSHLPACAHARLSTPTPASDAASPAHARHLMTTLVQEAHDSLGAAVHSHLA